MKFSIKNNVKQNNEPFNKTEIAFNYKQNVSEYIYLVPLTLWSV